MNWYFSRGEARLNFDLLEMFFRQRLFWMPYPSVYPSERSTPLGGLYYSPDLRERIGRVVWPAALGQRKH